MKSEGMILNRAV